MSAARSDAQRCPAIRVDGEPCTAMGGSSGFCVGHDPAAAEARRKGGAATSRASRAARLLPTRLRPVAALLEAALTQVHSGELEPRRASAMASLAGALIKTLNAGELEERLRNLESIARDQRKPGT